MVFATFGFYITIWFSKPAHRKAVFRYLQFPYSKTELFLAANEEIFTIFDNQMVKN